MGKEQFFIAEHPIVVLPSLVGVVGFARAVILQQIYYACHQPRSGRVLDDGYKWVWNTYKDWHNDYLPFLSERQIRRHILELEEKGFLKSCQANKADWDRTKYYRINYDVFVAHGKYLTLKKERELSAESGQFDDTNNGPFDEDTLGTFDEDKNGTFFLTNSSSNSSTEREASGETPPLPSQSLDLEMEQSPFDHPAVVLYTDKFGLNISRAFAKEIADTVKDLSAWSGLITDKIGYADGTLDERKRISRWFMGAYRERIAAKPVTAKLPSTTEKALSEASARSQLVTPEQMGMSL